LTGGGKGLKNQAKSNGYLCKFFKNLKYFADKFLEKVRSLNKTLTFVRSDKIGGVGSFAAREVPGASVFGLFIYQTVYRKIKKIVLRTKRKPLDRCTERYRLHGLRAKPLDRCTQNTASKLSLASCRGAILIEFAICMPILIILLFYIHDLMRIKRLYSQTEFVAQQMANILQNVARTRKITMADIKHAASLAYLTIYPGTTMYSKNNIMTCHEFFHMPRVYMFCVKGESNQKASCIWCCWTNTMTTRTDRWGYGSLTGNGQCVTRWRTNADPSTIYPTLKIEEGKYKIILEAQISWRDTYQNPIGKTLSSAREVFGLRLVNPKEYSTYAYFPSVVIFTPNSGFTEDVPT